MKATSGKRPKISILHDDIPEHVQELMQLTRMAEMGRLAANVAHELNNPLMVVQGFAENIELLLDQKDLPLEDIKLQILQILKSCQRMSRIINKMNRMSRNQRLRLHVVDLAEVALNAVDFMRTQFTDTDVKIEFDFDHPLPIKCDAVQVEQIILNILSNAVNALEGREDNRLVRISFEAAGKWHMARIWNNGPAIPASVQSGLMMPFFTTRPVGEGAGMGLAVSKAIMSVHGGDLTFKSSADRGTEFVLAFPKPKQNPWQQQEREGNGRVVIIDSQVNYRRTLQEKFRLLGFQTEAFAEHEAGFKALRHDTPNIRGVFVDVMPGLRESLEFIKKLRHELGPTGLIFVISNYPSARDFKSEIKASGATEFFEKPIHADNFTYILKLLDSPHTPAAATPPIKVAA